VPAESNPIERVERTNTVVVRNPLQEQREGGIRRDPYIMDVDRGRNCYSYGGFGHLAWNCRNQEIVGQMRRIEYRDNLNKVNEKESLVVLN